MLVTIRIENGPLAGHRAYVRPGQVLQVGRTHWADFTVPDDPGISNVHFALELAAGDCRVRDLNSESGTFVNGQAVADSILADGDRISAGETSFAVAVENTATAAATGLAVAGAATADNAAEKPAATSGFAHVETPLAQSVVAFIESGDQLLSDAAQELLQATWTVREFLEQLREAKLHADAVSFLAHALPKREAVWWASAACQETATEDRDATAVQTAQRWVVETNEENRRSAMTAGEATGYETAAGWCALAAAYSGGSLVGPELPEVPPAEHLTAQAAANSVTLAATAGDPADIAANYAAALALGIEVADGNHRWEED